jgi:hypothetical protein
VFEVKIYNIGDVIHDTANDMILPNLGYVNKNTFLVYKVCYCNLDISALRKYINEMLDNALSNKIDTLRLDHRYTNNFTRTTLRVIDFVDIDIWITKNKMFGLMENTRPYAEL